MKKTVTINISGIAFTIDDDAYEKLNRYLNSIGSYFSASEGRDEIIADIEARIAEMLQAKTGEKKQVISMSEVDEIIAAMGQPEQFAGADEIKSETKTKTKGNKRIYRDTEGKILGGVCSGFAYYFGFDPLWLRIGFAAAVFFGFGSGILIYILLWIIIPQAKTSAEKLEMKGESVNIDNIAKNIESEIDSLKKKVNEFKESKKESTKNFAGKLSDFLLNLLILLVNFFGKIFGFIFIIIAVALAIILGVLVWGEKAIISITPEGVNSFSIDGFSGMFFNSSEQSLLATIGLILLLGVPIVAMLYSGLKLIFGIKRKIKGVGVTFTALWLSGVVMCGIAAMLLAADFSEKETFVKEAPVIQSSTLYLKSSDSDEDFFLKIKDDSAAYSHVKFDIKRSETDSFQLQLHFTSRGKTSKEALELAKNIRYEFSQTDSLLQFNNYLSIAHSKWRNQYVKIVLKAPVGKAVFIDRTMKHLIYDIHNTTNTLDEDMVGKTWTMTKEGLADAE